MTTLIILLSLLLLLKLLPRLLAFALVRSVLGVFLKGVGAQALAQQPDEIRLEATRASPPPGVALLLPALRHAGFLEAGAFTIAEMPGVTVRLLAKSDEGVVAAACHHPQAGAWLDLVTKYGDGESFTLTTQARGGMDDRPGHPVVRAPGLSPLPLFQRMVRERPGRPFQRIEPERAAAFFTQAYAESVAWRKQRGLSAREVARVVRSGAE